MLKSAGLILALFIIFVSRTMAQKTVVPKICTGGVVNKTATFFPTPEYPKKAKKDGLEGTVIIMVIIDEEGKVSKADFCSGNPVFKKVSLKTAKKARFNPTTLSGQRVKVSGVIIYNFKLQAK